MSHVTIILSNPFTDFGNYRIQVLKILVSRSQINASGRASCFKCVTAKVKIKKINE